MTILLVTNKYIMLTILKVMRTSSVMNSVILMDEKIKFFCGFLFIAIFFKKVEESPNSIENSTS